MFVSFALSLLPLSSSLSLSQKLESFHIDRNGNWCVQGNLIKYEKNYTFLDGMMRRGRQVRDAEVLGKYGIDRCWVLVRVDGKSRDYKHPLYFSRSIEIQSRVCDRVAEGWGSSLFVGYQDSGRPNECKFSFHGLDFYVKPLFTQKWGTLVEGEYRSTIDMYMKCALRFSETAKQCCVDLANSYQSQPAKSAISFAEALNTECPEEPKYMRTADNSNAAAKNDICLREDPVKFDFTSTDGSQVSNYMRSNQQSEGCTLTLYYQAGNQYLSYKVPYDELLYTDATLSTIAFHETWHNAENKAIRAKTGVRKVEFDWCKEGMAIEFERQGKLVTAGVVKTNLVEADRFGSLEKLKCDVRIENERFSIRMLEPVTKVTTTTEGQFPDYHPVVTWSEYEY